MIYFYWSKVFDGIRYVLSIMQARYSIKVITNFTVLTILYANF